MSPADHEQITTRIVDLAEAGSIPVTTVQLPERMAEQAKAATSERTANGAIVTVLNGGIVRACVRFDSADVTLID